MNWVDLGIILILLYFIIESFGKSFISELIDLVSFLGAFILSIRFYNIPANILSDQFRIPYSLGNVISFMAVWFISETILILLSHIIFHRVSVLRHLNSSLKSLSFLPSLLKGVIFIAIILVVIATFPIQPRLKRAVDNSKIGSLILTKTYALETPLKNIFGGLTQEGLAFVTIKPKTNESVNLGFTLSQFSPVQELELEMINLVNSERQKRNLNLLTLSNELRNVARFHSADMFKRGYFAHYSPEGENVSDRAEKNQIIYLVIGENLAYAPNLKLAHDGLMNSEGHRANILSVDYHKIGIGIMDGGLYGLMVTQVFSN